MRNRTIATRVLLTLGILVMTVTAWAQPIQIEGKVLPHERNLTAFATSLQNDIPGIVEGSIYNVVLYKKYYPELDYSKIAGILNEVMLENKAASIRYKAQLAAMYLSQASSIEIVPMHGMETHEYIFKQIAQELEKKLLVSNN
jgi:hypothetical protein